MMSDIMCAVSTIVFRVVSIPSEQEIGYICHACAQTKALGEVQTARLFQRDA
jgi:hypothetical protein